ncbi:uncharacterized protein BJ171DRAFT_576145 [Polychytrium aggregatum]|uniref:uncharacterized protein n=1 Tax=Polychytrium aggregatum TaxID=110093 RepID=UPI0022FDF296|nr:uncharacterized protein BJ171DRAFT_576145 [Polychytrium aggregatum]KAI9179338.1 hypothetical protein BJ171DRAFT_576145 [Polychytrium aggregatum]
MSSPKPSPTPSMRAPMATAAHSITSSGQEAGPIAFALQALSNSAHTSNFSGSTLGNGQYATQTSSLPTAQAQALQLQLKQLQLQFQLQNQLQANGSALNPSILQLQSSVAPQAHPSLQNTTSSLFAQFKTQAQAHAHAQAQVHGQTQAQVQAQALQLVGEEAAVGTPSPAVVQATQLHSTVNFEGLSCNDTWTTTTTTTAAATILPGDPGADDLLQMPTGIGADRAIVFVSLRWRMMLHARYACL